MALTGIIVGVVHTVIGIMGFITFLSLRNYASAVWAFHTGIVGAVIAHLNYQAFKYQLDRWYGANELKAIFIGGFGTFAICSAGFVYHMTMEILSGRAVMPVDKSHVIPMIWAFLALKSGLVLMYYTYRYRRGDNLSMLEDPEEAQDPSN